MSLNTTTTPTRTPGRAIEAGTWIAAIVGSLAYAFATFCVSVFIAWANATTCNQAATGDDQINGELSLLVALLVAATPWLIGALFGGRNRPAFIVGGLIGIAPLVCFLLAGLDRGFWAGSFCF